MDDLFSKIQQVLSSEEGQAQLRNVAQMLNMNTPPSSPSPQNHTQTTPSPDSSNPTSTPVNESNSEGGFDFSALSNILSSLSGSTNDNNGDNSPNESNHSDSNNGFDLSGIDINMILRMQQLIQNMNTDDDTTRLLIALKPHFSDKRKGKVDQAIQLLRIYALLPIIKESGLLGGLFNHGGT